MFKKGIVDMKDMVKLDLLIEYDKDKNKTCICNYHNPNCPKGYDNRCQRLKVFYNPYCNIEECYRNESKTYKKVHGRYREKS